MYSGDEFYGEEITSPLYRPQNRFKVIRPAQADVQQSSVYSSYSSWLGDLEVICINRTGGTTMDLELDIPAMVAAYEDGTSPQDYWDEDIEPDLD